MKKYKQTIIPSVKTTQYKNLGNYTKGYYSKYLQGKNVINRHLKIPIYLGSDGKGKLSFDGTHQRKKTAIRLYFNAW